MALRPLARNELTETNYAETERALDEPDPVAATVRGEYEGDAPAAPGNVD